MAARPRRPILGATSDQQAAALHTAALRSLNSHELIEWRDPTDRNSLPTTVTYPPLKRPALFLCTARACSSPIYQPEEVAAKIHKAQLFTDRNGFTIDWLGAGVQRLYGPLW